MSAGASHPTVLVTQGEGAAGSLGAALAALGADVLAIPSIMIEPPDDAAPLDGALAALERYDWIVFTSRHAVEAVAARPAWAANRARAGTTLRVAAVGKATAAALAAIGISADLVPEKSGGSDLADLMAASAGSRDPDAARQPARSQLAGVRILWPRSDIARRELPETLRKAGADLDEPIAYRASTPTSRDAGELHGRIDASPCHAAAFMSPSSARNLAALLGWGDLAPLAARTVIASIGPTTSASLRELSAPPQVESAERTADDLARTLIAYLASHPSKGRTG